MLLSTLLLSIPSFAKQEIVVLVPGFFNSFTPEYFSDEIVNSFQKRGLKVYVAGDLNPVGTVEDNGARLSNFFSRIEANENQKVDFNIVAHSAGGLYALYVANQNKFTIKNLITIATPYKGVEFLQKWLDNSFLFKALTDLAHLDGLKQLTPAGIAKFMSGIRVSPNMKIIAYAGEQGRSLDIWDARNLSLPFEVTSSCISEASDGIVGVSSALGVGQIRTTEGKQAIQLLNRNYKIGLEHWEQVLGGYSFLILGIRNPGYIVDEQTRFYGGIADYLLKLL